MSRSDDFLLNPEELRARKLKRRRRAVIAVLLLGALAVAAFAAKPTSRALKGWQARRHAEKAFSYIDQQKWSEAQDAAVAAYQLKVAEPQAIRAVARLLSRTGQPQALEFWDRLKERQPLTLEDTRDEAQASLVAGETSRANAAIQRLLTPETGKPAAGDWLLAARAATQTGDLEAAGQYLDEVLADPTTTEKQQFQAALMSIGSPDQDPDARQVNRSRAWARLAQIARSSSESGLDALLVLAQHGATGAISRAGSETAQSGELPSIDELASAIERHPLAQGTHKLIAVDLRLGLDPTRREELLSAAIETWRDADAAGLAALLTWLNGKGEHERVVQIVPVERALESRETFLPFVDALGALNRWDEIKRLLEAERFPLDPVVQRMYLARTNAQLGEKTASDNNWQRALEAASGDVRKLMMLAEYAEKNGATQTANIAYSQATSIAPKLRSAWQGRLRTTYATRDTRRSQHVLAEMLQMWPDDPALQNDEAYMRLLLISDQEPAGTDQKSDVSSERPIGAPPTPNEQATDEDLAAIEQLAQNLVEANPASLPHRTLLALARLKQGRAADALQVYGGIQAAANALTPSALAVHAAVLHANGKVDDARAEIAQVPTDALLPEERALTAKW